MSSSIFNFSGLRAVLPPREARPFAVLTAGALVLTLALGCLGLYRLFFTRNYQVMAVEALGPDTRLVFLGSSRVFFGVDPARYATKAVPLAANFLDLTEAEALWQLHAAKATAVDTVLVELDIATTDYATRVIAPHGLHPLGLSILPRPADFMRDFLGSVRLLLSPIYKWRLTPAFLRTHAQILRSPLEPQNAAPGYIPSDVEMSFPEVFAPRKITQARDQLVRFGPEVRARNLAALAGLIASLDRRGIRVALVRFPMEKELRRLYPEEWHAATRAAVTQLKDDPRQLRFAFWDLSLDERFATTDFRDPDHLNRQGAARLAPVLEALVRTLPSQ